MSSKSQTKEGIDNLQKVYLKKVYLDGYKTIHNLGVDLLPSLNIIIGKNGTGKTNFFNFLSKALEFNYTDLFSFETELTFSDKNSTKIIASKRFKEVDFFSNLTDPQTLLNKMPVEYKIKVKDREYVIPENTIAQQDLLQKHKIRFKFTKIPHGIPDEFPLVKQPLIFTVNNGEVVDDLFVFLRNASVPDFIRNILFGVVFEFYPSRNVETPKDNDRNDIDSLKARIKSIFSAINYVNPLLSKYSIIQEVRLKDDFSVSTTNGSTTFSNLLFEFKVNDAWHHFDSLSDGTKRIFFIIAEIAFLNVITLPSSYSSNVSEAKFLPMEGGIIVLLEEPELGIHPHQLHLLMLFLAQQAKSKQILITTHSPQVLDVLSSNELNRILIAELQEQNTKLSHLTDAQIQKAKTYMEDLYLSDYWIHSDLEPGIKFKK